MIGGDHQIIPRTTDSANPIAVVPLIRDSDAACGLPTALQAMEQPREMQQPFFRRIAPNTYRPKYMLSSNGVLVAGATGTNREC